MDQEACFGFFPFWHLLDAYEPIDSRLAINGNTNVVAGTLHEKRNRGILTRVARVDADPIRRR
jgi:hypothetical protein